MIAIVTLVKTVIVSDPDAVAAKNKKRTRYTAQHTHAQDQHITKIAIAILVKTVIVSDPDAVAAVGESLSKPSAVPVGPVPSLSKMRSGEGARTLII